MIISLESNFLPSREINAMTQSNLEFQENFPKEKTW